MIDVNFTKRFKGFTLNVCFKADQEIVALFGASGSGKSLTLKCIAGIYQPDAGHIVLNDRILFDSEKGINLIPQERRSGLLFQNYALFPNMTVERNIACGLRGHLTNAERHEAVQTLIDAFYLRGHEKHYPEQLSGGQQQRTALARILAGNPEILMLDEPLSALDSYLRWQLEQELISTLSNLKLPTLYVSHNRGEVYRICEKIVLMENGKSNDLQDVKHLFDVPRTYSAALLSGCKNFSPIKRIRPDAIWIENWQIEIKCRKDLSENIRLIGVQAGRIYPNMDENQVTCIIERITEDINHCIITLQPEFSSNRNDQSRLLMELSKESANQLSEGQLLKVGFRQADILFLE